MSWQPIETAPRDGSRIMLFARRGNHDKITFGWFNDDRYSKRPRPYWSDDRERVFGTRDTRGSQPTHWMPLPPPPTV